MCLCVCAEIILSLNKMNNVISFDPVSGVLVAQVERKEGGKGLILEQQHQQEQDDTMPLIYTFILFYRQAAFCSLWMNTWEKEASLCL